MPATSQIEFTDECHSKRQPKHAPRAPNAFMLYRSDFIRRRAVPPEVERRQQNLSRIAGQCWNRLPESEKAIWYDKAAAVREEYYTRYSSHKTGPFHKDTNRLPVENSSGIGAATNPRRPCGQPRARRTQTPYSRSMFAAIRDPRSSPATSLTSLISPTAASGSPLSTTASLSPLRLSQFLPSLTSHTNFSSQDTPSASSENSTKNEVDDLLALLGLGTPQHISHIIRDSQNMPSGVSSQPTLQRYENGFSTCVPYPDLERIRNLRSDPVSHLPPFPSETNVFSPVEYYLANNIVTDNVAHFNPSLVPLYP